MDTNDQPLHRVFAHAAESYEVDPDRLLHGRWSHREQRRIGEGDICASYSADTIALQGRVRRPFTFREQLWVCVGLSGAEAPVAKAYRLQLLSVFQGAATTYLDKVQNAAEARNDPQGFYHGIKIKSRGQDHVLIGPPTMFRPDSVVQPGLFECG